MKSGSGLQSSKKVPFPPEIPGRGQNFLSSNFRYHSHKPFRHSYISNSAIVTLSSSPLARPSRDMPQLSFLRAPSLSGKRCIRLFLAIIITKIIINNDELIKIIRRINNYNNK